jgi:hypothetical protein
LPAGRCHDGLAVRLRGLGPTSTRFQRRGQGLESRLIGFGELLVARLRPCLVDKFFFCKMQL